MDNMLTIQPPQLLDFFSDKFGIDNVRHCNSCLFHLHQDNISAEKRLRSEFNIILEIPLSNKRVTLEI